MKGQTRRHTIAGLSLLAFAGPSIARAGTSRKCAEGALLLELKFADGTVQKFVEREATELAPFVDPQGRFVQLCRVARKPESPFTVFFRRDKDGGRLEVVVELGAVGKKPMNTGAYVATIGCTDGPLASVEIARHYWWSRWRWQSEPRPVRKTAGQLQAAGLTPAMDAHLALGQDGPDAPHRYTPMSFPGLASDMTDTGERAEIGLMTTAQAQWLCTQDAAALEELLVQGEAHASVPVHVRDETSGPISIERYPTVSSFWDPDAGHAHPWVSPAPDTRVQPDKSHYPSLAYIPFLLTGDPYFLEEIQFTAQAALLKYNTDYRQRNKGILGDEDARGWAWSIRSLFQAVLATPQKVPRWLADRSYFERILANNLAWFTEKQINDRNALKSNCHFATTVPFDSIAPWQQDFLTTVLGWAVLAGFSDWRPAFQWQSEQAISRARGVGGYPKSQAIQYFYKTKGATDWRSLAQANGLSETPDGQFPSSTDLNYAAYLRGALVYAERLKMSGASEALDYANEQVSRLRWLPYKWAFARGR